MLYVNNFTYTTIDAKAIEQIRTVIFSKLYFIMFISFIYLFVYLITYTSYTTKAIQQTLILIIIE